MKKIFSFLLVITLITSSALFSGDRAPRDRDNKGNALILMAVLATGWIIYKTLNYLNTPSIITIPIDPQHTPHDSPQLNPYENNSDIPKNKKKQIDKPNHPVKDNPKHETSPTPQPTLPVTRESELQEKPPVSPPINLQPEIKPPHILSNDDNLENVIISALSLNYL